MRSLQQVLETIDKYNNGEIVLSEEVVECQRLLRESEVLGELENGNVYVLRYVEDNKLYALRNYNMSTLMYISEYEEYINKYGVDE